MQKGFQNDVKDFAKTFFSFLSGRSQKVVLEGKSSSSTLVLSDVPQGSVLGSVLFLIYINDLQEYIFNSTVRPFVHDTLIYLTNHKSSDCIKLQEDLNPASILRKSTSGRHRPVSYPDGPMTARYRFT